MQIELVFNKGTLIVLLSIGRNFKRLGSYEMDFSSVTQNSILSSLPFSVKHNNKTTRGAVENEPKAASNVWRKCVKNPIKKTHLTLRLENLGHADQRIFMKII